VCLQLSAEDMVPFMAKRLFLNCHDFMEQAKEKGDLE
jgi:hypothetical protein